MLKATLLSCAYAALRWLALPLALGAVLVSTGGATPVRITITADNSYDLYVNGSLVGSQNNADGTWGWDAPEAWVVDMSPGVGVIAVAAQDESPASSSGIGLIAKIEIDGGTTYVTDMSWKVSESGPQGWNGMSFDDAAWSSPLDEGPYDSVPWTRFAPPIAAFASTGARWLWRGTPPYQSGYGYYNAGGYQYCFFRKQVLVGEAPPPPPTGCGSICGQANEGSSLTLTAPPGTVFVSIDFASYGTPTGICGAYALGGCHAVTSTAILLNACLGQTTCTVSASNDVFGDPCYGTVKRLYVEASCGPAPTQVHHTTWGALKTTYR